MAIAKKRASKKKVTKPKMVRTQFEEGEYEYAQGGHVSKGEMVWGKLTQSKKADFLYKNFTPEITPASQETLSKRAYKFLPKNVKSKIESVYANAEEYAHGGSMYRKGGVMGDIYSIQNAKQFEQLITTYNELSKRFGVVNYFLDHNDNSVVFLMHDEDSINTMELQKYVNSLYQKGFDIFDKAKNKNIVISKDNSQGGGYVYFKLKLSGIVEYANGGGVGKEEFVKFGDLAIGNIYFQVTRPDLGIEKIEITKKENGTYTYKSDNNSDETYVTKYSGRYTDNEKLYGIFSDKDEAKQMAINLLTERMSKYAEGGGVGRNVSKYELEKLSNLAYQLQNVEDSWIAKNHSKFVEMQNEYKKQFKKVYGHTNYKDPNEYANGGEVGEFDSEGYSYEVYYRLEQPEILVKKEKSGRYAIFNNGIYIGSNPTLDSARGQAEFIHNRSSYMKDGGNMTSYFCYEIGGL